MVLNPKMCKKHWFCKVLAVLGAISSWIPTLLLALAWRLIGFSGGVVLPLRSVDIVGIPVTSSVLPVVLVRMAFGVVPAVSALLSIIPAAFSVTVGIFSVLPPI